VQDTFIVASARLGRLRDPDLLKPWLFAVARNECRRRLRARPGGAGDGEAGEPGGFGVDVERADLREVIGAAMTALPADQRELVELSLGQDFDRDDLALTLGISAGHAQVLASRARAQFGKQVGTLLVARSGRWSCEGLDELLEDHGSLLTAAMRRDLSQHVQHCRICSRRVHRDLPPAVLLSAPPATEAARELRAQVLSLVASCAPDIVAYRADVVRGAEPFEEASGFPVPVDQPRRERRLRPATLAFGATALVAVLCAIGLEFGPHHHAHRQQLAAAPLSSQPSSSAQVQASSPGQARAPRASAPARPGSLAAATPRPTPTVSGSPSLSPAPAAPLPPGSRPPVPPSSTPPSTPTPPPTTPPTTPPTPAPGTLAVSPASVTLSVPAGGGAASGAFTLTAVGGAVSYSISVPLAYAGELAVSPASGSLASGASVTVSVTWNSSAALSTSLAVEPGGQAVSVSYQPPD
jgi:RNA polymerase sigma factor (sigma-70 family)